VRGIPREPAARRNTRLSPVRVLSTNMRRLSIALALVVMTLMGGVAYLLRDPLGHFFERRSSVASLSERELAPIGSSRLHAVHIVATSGLEVDLNVKRPAGDSGRLPLVVVLGGHLTGAEAVRLLGDTPGVIVAAVSYPFTGDPRPSTTTVLRQIPRIRAAFHDTPPALMLALDYLLTRPDVDPSRVEAVGVSLGAPFVTMAAAIDNRFTRVWAIHGSGGSYAPLEANMKRTIPFAPLRYLSATIANIIIGGPRLAPERWAQRITPRPFIMVNATDDERLPRKSIDKLYRHASEPKEQIWMSGKHIHGDQETIQRLVGIVMARVILKENPGNEN
jgi:dienelactone hydrolase